MANKTPKSNGGRKATRKQYEVELPKLPSDFLGAQYGNRLEMSASAQELYIDLFQIAPDTGGRGVAVTTFMGRFIIPLVIAKKFSSDVQQLVEQIEEDTGVQLVETEEV